MEYSLTLTANEVSYLLEVLNQRPFKEVAGLIPKIIEQTQVQQPPKQEATPEAE